MKKLVALLLLFSSPVYALSDCADKPTCEEIGYKFNKCQCGDKQTIPCPFDNTKLYCPGPVCEVGYYLYSDGSCSLSLKQDKLLIGIIFDEQNRLAISTKPAEKLFWSNHSEQYLPIEPAIGCTQTDPCVFETCNGQTSTKYIIDFALANNYSFPAAEYCWNFDFGNKGKGSWWLPSTAELKKIYNNKSQINSSLTTANLTELSASSHWSSNQTNNTSLSANWAWFLNLGSGASNHFNEKSAQSVICITRY